MKVSPTLRRSQCVQSPLGLEIEIPSRKQILYILFLGFWLCGWAFGEVMVLKELLKVQASRQNSALFLTVWVCAWSVGGVVAIYTWLWFVVGRERITFTHQSIKMRREIFGLGRTREFELPSVKNMRPRGIVSSAVARSGQIAFFEGMICFDYGSQTYHFGIGLSEAESRLLISEICALFPGVAMTAR